MKTLSKILALAVAAAAQEQAAGEDRAAHRDASEMLHDPPLNNLGK